MASRSVNERREVTLSRGPATGSGLAAPHGTLPAVSPPISCCPRQSARLAAAIDPAPWVLARSVRSRRNGLQLSRACTRRTGMTVEPAADSGQIGSRVRFQNDAPRRSEPRAVSDAPLSHQWQRGRRR